MTFNDARHMARALQLAERGLYTADPNPRVGCVIVKDDVIVGEGAHLVAGEAHAEVHALRAAGERARGATAYVTLEPCCHTGRTPPCSEALKSAGVTRVVAAMEDPNPRVAGGGARALRNAGIAVDVGMMQAQAEALNPGFISRMRRGRPFVRSKLAASLDGRTALANGVSRWISGEAARADVQHWRARSSAILTGSGTVLADNPSLNVRTLSVTRQPARIVIDSRLRTPTDAKLLTLPGKRWIATNAADTARAAALTQAGAEVIRIAGDSNGKTDLAALMRVLAEREINEVLVEAGAELNGALLHARLIDEIIVYFAPHLLGGTARPLFDLPPLAAMTERVALEITDTRAVGKDWRVSARVVYRSED